MDWLPVSAALLLTGALALCLGAFLLPSSDGAAETLMIVQEQGGRWIVSAVFFFLAAVCLSLGVPAILALFHGRGATLGLVSAIVLVVGFIGTAGFAMLMAFVRSLVLADALKPQGLEEASDEAGLAVFLAVWVGGLYVGELLLGIALLRAGTTARWVPVALILHVLTFPISGALPEMLSKATVLLMVLGFAGIAIQATSPANRRRVS